MLIMSKKRKSEYKPLLLTTTLRNPERIKKYMAVIAKYNGMILTNEIIDKVVFDLVSTKIYIPMYVRQNADLKVQLNNEDPFSYNDTKRIIENSKQVHKEPGFEKGWPSRFDTWYEFPKELGLVYYEIDKPIEVSEAGHNLVLSNNEGYEHLEQQVFLSSFVKYQSNNPFKRVLNKNKPLILLIQVILKLKEILGENSPGVSISEIPLFICWKNNDYLSLTNKIIEIRNNFGVRPSKEYIYGICKSILNFTEKEENRFKIKNLCHEMPDDYIRKMRMTGLISIRGAGRFIDINNQEIDKIKYVVENYSELIEFSNERQYFDYVKNIDLSLVNLKKNIIYDNSQSQQLFMKWVNLFDYDTLKRELLIVCRDKDCSRNEILKYIHQPLRLEFLTALILQKKFTDLIVKPNYIFDDEGMPTFFAPGNSADIQCLDEKGNILFEVTLIRGRQQVTSEMIPIERHLKEIRQNDSNAFSVFLAPNIHPDAIQYAAFSKFQSGLDIITMDIPTFASTLDEKVDIRNYL